MRIVLLALGQKSHHSQISFHALVITECNKFERSIVKGLQQKIFTHLFEGGTVHCRYILREESRQISIVGNGMGHIGPQGVLTEGSMSRRLLKSKFWEMPSVNWKLYTSSTDAIKPHMFHLRSEKKYAFLMPTMELLWVEVPTGKFMGHSKTCLILMTSVTCALKLQSFSRS